MKCINVLLFILLGCCLQLCASQLYRYDPGDERLIRELRYGFDQFDIVNGEYSFNRPLYGGNTAFRVDCGDRPEFVLYKPGRVGNFRIGFTGDSGVTKWFIGCDVVKARYFPGEMVYEISDKEMAGEVVLSCIVPWEFEGLIVWVRVERSFGDSDIVWAFGCNDMKKGRRGGDIGCEREPVEKFFAFSEDGCKGNKFEILDDGFVIDGKAGRWQCRVSADTEMQVADAGCWDKPGELFGAAKGVDKAVIAGKTKVGSVRNIYLVMAREGELPGGWSLDEYKRLFSKAADSREKVAEKVLVSTPDEYIDNAAGALCVAADAIWDEQHGAVMHGAVAWRRKLLGWRGPYANDALGWHERSRRHLLYWAGQQDESEVLDAIPQADEVARLSRNETALHSNGTMSKSHYDMNLVYIDCLFRHLLWTGDMELARELWPVIVRHLDWEKRLFRREFGDDNLPLYEAYAAIWASDDMQYNGGGVAYSSAYNYYHNVMAARIAEKLGEDAGRFLLEAAAIKRGMNKYLWFEGKGVFGEYKDYLGNQLVHPVPGLWSIYHVIDSELATPQQAWQMSRYVDNNIAHFAIVSPGLPGNDCFTLASSNWMPYSWSVNNVVMAEVSHSSLAFWQAGRSDMAYRMFKGCVLDSMYLGKCPGNVGTTTYYDMARGESQRDFGDGTGIVSRALVEGLFGVRPDMLAGELVIRPGFPEDWERASLNHADIKLDYKRDGNVEEYRIADKFKTENNVVLEVPALSDVLPVVTVDGEVVSSSFAEDVSSKVLLRVKAGKVEDSKVRIEWPDGEGIGQRWLFEDGGNDKDRHEYVSEDWRGVDREKIRQYKVDLSGCFNDSVCQIFENEYRSPRSPYCSLAIPVQGIGSWCNYKRTFAVDDSGLDEYEKGVFPIDFSLCSGKANTAFVSMWDNYPESVTVPVNGSYSYAYFVVTGSTNSMQCYVENARIAVDYEDGTSKEFVLVPPYNYWPIDQDYYVDDHAFYMPGPLLPRLHLADGKVYINELPEFKKNGGEVAGGAANIVEMRLDRSKRISSIKIEAVANEVVVGVMAVTLVQ